MVDQPLQGKAFVPERGHEGVEMVKGSRTEVNWASVAENLQYHFKVFGIYCVDSRKP